MLLLPLPHHEDGDVRLRVALPDELEQVLVDRVAGGGERPLVLLGRIAAAHDAEVGRAGADVDDQCVQQRVESVSHGERLADDHQAVDDPLHRVAQVLLVRAQRGGGDADHGPDVGAVDAAVLAHADEAQ